MLVVLFPCVELSLSPPVMGSIESILIDPITWPVKKRESLITVKKLGAQTSILTSVIRQ